MAVNPHTPVSSSVTNTKVPKFLRCLYDMLHFEDQSILAWTHDGTCFQVRDVARLERDVLPKYFKHGKFTSFQRQLNTHGFHKWTKTRAHVCTFSHDALVQCHPSQLFELLRSSMVTSPKPMSTMKRERVEEPTSLYQAQSVNKKIKIEPPACFKLERFGIDIKVDPSSHESLEHGVWAFDSIDVALCALDWTQGMSDAVTSLILEPLDWELGAECFAAIATDFAVSTSFLDVGW